MIRKLLNCCLSRDKPYFFYVMQLFKYKYYDIFFPLFSHSVHNLGNFIAYQRLNNSVVCQYYLVFLFYFSFRSFLYLVLLLFNPKQAFSWMRNEEVPHLFVFICTIKISLYKEIYPALSITYVKKYWKMSPS